MIDSKNSINIIIENNKREKNFRLYKKRWLMLIIFILFTFVNSLQWGEYIIISDKVVKYYGIEAEEVDWTMQLYMVTYIILIFPALKLLAKTGIRCCLMLSCAGLTIGAWIKVYASISPDRFPFVLLGQAIEAIFQVLIFGLAARVVGVWFGSNEISFACALAVFGDQMGSAVGFFLPSMIVKSKDRNGIGINLTVLNLIIAMTSTVTFISASLLFKERPKTPPNATQILQEKSQMIMSGINATMKSKSFIAMMVSYGINVAVYNTYMTLFNTSFSYYFQPEQQEHIGFISTLVMLSGIVGSIFMGYILDRTHLYKEITVALYIFSFLGMLLSTFAFRSRILELVYISNLLAGFCQLTYYSIAIQLAIEMTYPISESFSSSELLLTSHILGILFGQVYRKVYNTKGDVYANLGLCFLLLIGIFLTVIIPPKMKRYNKEKNCAIPN